MRFAAGAHKAVHRHGACDPRATERKHGSRVLSHCHRACVACCQAAHTPACKERACDPRLALLLWLPSIAAPMHTVCVLCVSTHRLLCEWVSCHLDHEGEQDDGKAVAVAANTSTGQATLQQLRDRRGDNRSVHAHARTHNAHMSAVSTKQSSVCIQNPAVSKHCRGRGAAADSPINFCNCSWQLGLP